MRLYGRKAELYFLAVAVAMIAAGVAVWWGE